MDVSKLIKLGLTESESKIYSSVLRLKICTVRDICKDCGFHRTNIYDILEQLKEKGLITYFKEGKTTKYQISDPKNLYSFLEEKKEILDSIFPDIERLHSYSNEEIHVEVFKGEEGMKAFLRDVIREGKTLYAFGVKGQLRERMPLFAQEFLRGLKNNNIKYYAIYTEKNAPSYYTEIRYLPKDIGGPVAIFIYGDKININIWEPSLVAITIKSKLVSQMYKQHFDLLWKIAKK